MSATNRLRRGRGYSGRREQRLIDSFRHRYYGTSPEYQAPGHKDAIAALRMMGIPDENPNVRRQQRNIRKQQRAAR